MQTTITKHLFKSDDYHNLYDKIKDLELDIYDRSQFSKEENELLDNISIAKDFWNFFNEGYYSWVITKEQKFPTLSNISDISTLSNEEYNELNDMWLTMRRKRSEANKPKVNIHLLIKDIYDLILDEDLSWFAEVRFFLENLPDNEKKKGDLIDIYQWIERLLFTNTYLDEGNVETLTGKKLDELTISERVELKRILELIVNWNSNKTAIV